MKRSYGLVLVTLLTLTACASVKMVEADNQGGLVQYRRRGLAKDARHDQALQKADEHCKHNGFATYQIEKEYENGRYQDIRFSCKK